ncbi:hypothetical protein P1P75_38935 [Streptomyces sp. ID05-39B]|uniref:hypothetical protein n=1 Tax=Streptomyces sp. ID05-39B TaxID=3028664 RepID=UPI0029A5948E|nr:hypothetical protein [Streptomyces sp. ID05-39B]MDX3532214.1 hypothetical protein [Streptomyces sp. ID05-39B]
MVTPDVSDTISPDKGAHILREWMSPHGDVSAELEAELQQAVFDPLAAADHIYYLHELGDEAIHDWGRVHDDFHEFVLIDRSSDQITLLVAADD